MVAVRRRLRRQALAKIFDRAKAAGPSRQAKKDRAEQLAAQLRVRAPPLE